MTVEAHLATLERKHGALEQELHSAMNRPSTTDTLLVDLKRRKLRLKDEIERLKSSIH